MLWDVPFIPNIPVWTADATDWDSFAGGAGPTLGTDFDRPAGGFIDMQQYGEFETADITAIVQAWAKGAGNYGVIVMGNTADYWSVEGIGNATPAKRPRLVVDYAPVQSRTIVFQQGVNGYFDCSMLRVGQNNTTLRPQLIVLVQGKPADLNNDMYVDETDVAQFIACAAGPAIPFAPGCDQADLDEDGDVDSADFGVIQACYSGTLEASPECAGDNWIDVQ